MAELPRPPELSHRRRRRGRGRDKAGYSLPSEATTVAPAAGERRLELGRRVGVFAVGDPDTFGMTGEIIESEFVSFERKVTRLESSRRDSEYSQSAVLHLDGAFSAEAAAQLGSQTAQEGEIVIEGYVKDGLGVDIELRDWEYLFSDKVTHDLVAWSLSPAELGWLSSCCQGMRVDVERGRRRRRLAVQRRHGKG